MTRECFSCGQPLPDPRLYNTKMLKALLRDWRRACAELAAARRHRLPSERRADMKVARMERDIVRHCWSEVFNNGRMLRGMPKTARAHITSRR